MADMSFVGGDYAMSFGNQQWTFRDISVTGARVAAVQVGRWVTRCHACVFTGESRPMRGFILAETLVLAGTAGDNGTAGGTLHQPVLVFLVG